eukprot:jgi/Botrbrau1/10895/Bobra.0025s0070.1
MWKRWALIIMLIAATVARGDDSDTKITKSSEVKTMTDLVGLTDDELYAVFSDPGPDPGHMPSQDQKDTWDLCAGLTLVNAFSTGGTPRGPLPVGRDHIVNAVVNPVWQGKVFYTDSATNQTWLWNVMYNNHTVELTATCQVLPHGEEGKYGVREDGPPSSWCDYSQTENPVGRIFRGEMRYLGNNVYLGRQFMTNPAVAYTPSALRDPVTQQIRDAFVTVFNNTLNAGLLAARIQGPGTGHPLATPQQVTWFTLQCGFPVTSRMEQTPGSTVSTAFLNEAFAMWPLGYRPPVLPERGFENSRASSADDVIEMLPGPRAEVAAAAPFAASRHLRNPFLRTSEETLSAATP